MLQSGSPATSGNIAVTIWSNGPDTGSVIYSDNFANAISDGFFDLMLGSSSELNLTYGTFYYLDMSINGQDINWTDPSSGQPVNRIQFQSQNGQISAGQIQLNAVNASHLNSTGTYYMGRLEIANISSLPLNVSGVLFVNGTTGRVGINTTSPNSMLSVKGATGIEIVSDISSNRTFFAGRSGAGTEVGYMNLFSSGTVGVQLRGAGDSYFNTGGNVGIGTTSPTTKLEVSGDLNVTGYIKSGCPSDMVPVGNRAFCIDKYEASAASGSVGHYSGNDTTAVADSRDGVAPQASVTWFQAAVACANAGKRLCTNQEWTVACLGTPDTTSCNINSAGTPLNTGSLANCKSRWGAYDMVGNVWEWVADWGTGGLASSTFADGTSYTPWSGYGDGGDGTWNLNTREYANAYGPGWTSGLPGAFVRGGGWVYGAVAGCFAVDLTYAPSGVGTTVGFRCCK